LKDLCSLHYFLGIEVQKDDDYRIWVHYINCLQKLVILTFFNPHGLRLLVMILLNNKNYSPFMLIFNFSQSLEIPMDILLLTNKLWRPDHDPDWTSTVMKGPIPAHCPHMPSYS
jgi:hypothetical protein